MLSTTLTCHAGNRWAKMVKPLGADCARPPLPALPVPSHQVVQTPPNVYVLVHSPLRHSPSDLQRWPSALVPPWGSAPPDMLDAGRPGQGGRVQAGPSLLARRGSSCCPPDSPPVGRAQEKRRSKSGEKRKGEGREAVWRIPRETMGCLCVGLPPCVCRCVCFDC